MINITSLSFGGEYTKGNIFQGLGNWEGLIWLGLGLVIILVVALILEDYLC